MDEHDVELRAFPPSCSRAGGSPGRGARRTPRPPRRAHPCVLHGLRGRGAWHQCRKGLSRCGRPAPGEVRRVSGGVGWRSASCRRHGGVAPTRGWWSVEGGRATSQSSWAARGCRLAACARSGTLGVDAGSSKAVARAAGARRRRAVSARAVACSTRRPSVAEQGRSSPWRAGRLGPLSPPSSSAIEAPSVRGDGAAPRQLGAGRAARSMEPLPRRLGSPTVGPSSSRSAVPGSERRAPRRARPRRRRWTRTVPAGASGRRAAMPWPTSFRVAATLLTFVVWPSSHRSRKGRGGAALAVELVLRGQGSRGRDRATRARPEWRRVQRVGGTSRDSGSSSSPSR